MSERAARRGGAGWTADEEAAVRAHPELGAAALGRMLGRTADAVATFRRRLRGRGG